jgi:hypothetical protein
VPEFQERTDGVRSMYTQRKQAHCPAEQDIDFFLKAVEVEGGTGRRRRAIEKGFTEIRHARARRHGVELLDLLHLESAGARGIVGEVRAEEEGLVSVCIVVEGYFGVVENIP